MMQELPPTISVEQAAAVLGISRRSAYRAAAIGELPTLRLGRRLLVPTARLLELLGLPADGVRASADLSGPVTSWKRRTGHSKASLPVDDDPEGVGLTGRFAETHSP